MQAVFLDDHMLSYWGTLSPGLCLSGISPSYFACALYTANVIIWVSPVQAPENTNKLAIS